MFDHLKIDWFTLGRKTSEFESMMFCRNHLKHHQLNLMDFLAWLGS